MYRQQYERKGMATLTFISYVERTPVAYDVRAVYSSIANGHRDEGIPLLATDPASLAAAPRDDYDVIEQ